MGGGGSLYTYVFLLRKASGSQGWFKLAELISRKPCNYKIEFVAGLRKSCLLECRADWATSIQTTLHCWCWSQMWWGFMKKFNLSTWRALSTWRKSNFTFLQTFVSSVLFPDIKYPRREFLGGIFIESSTHTNSWMSGTIVFWAKLSFQGFRNCLINTHVWGTYSII